MSVTDTSLMLRDVIIDGPLAVMYNVHACANHRQGYVN